MPGTWTPALERWMDGLAVELLARGLSAADPNAKARCANLKSGLDHILGLLSEDNPKYLEALPLSALRALADKRLEAPLGSTLIESAHLASHRLASSPRTGMPAPTAAARLLAQLLLEGTCSAAFIVRCAGAMLSKSWRSASRNEEWKPAAERYLASLRATAFVESADDKRTIKPADTFGRIRALHDLTSALPSHANWVFVENAVFDQLFAWPLLVASPQELRDGNLSLPIAVDVILDGKGVVRPEPDETGPTTSLQTEWEPHLERAVRVAKDLWRSKHGSVSKDFRERVDSASVFFDLGVAQRIARWTPFNFELIDSSMIPYLSQVVLHRLLGRGVGFSCAVIGTLGDQVSGLMGPGLDYDLNMADGTDRKLSYAFRRGGFARIALSPQEPAERIRQARRSTDSTFTELNICQRFSNVADAVQPHGWRQQRYVRCPDVLRLLHLAADELLPPDHPEVQEVGRMLTRNEEPVLHLSASVRMLPFLSYLHYANGQARESVRPDTPPSLAWAVIRATDGDNDRGFWHTVWHRIGAPWDQFKRFRHATNATDAAVVLGQALDTFSPIESALSHRAPDLLIVFNADVLDAADKNYDGAEYRSHLFGPIIEAVSKRGLLPTPNVGMAPFIGNTRIVVINDGREEVVGTHSRSCGEIDELHEAALVRLSTFRFGFTQHMAQLLLDDLRPNSEPVRPVLRALARSQHLGYAAGQYWVKGNIGQDATAGWTDKVKVRRHWAAAKAFAPYMVATETALQIDLNAALLPERVHEALYHTEFARGIEALQTGSLLHNDRRRQQLITISTFKGKLLRFVRLPSPGTVHDLTKDHFGLSPSAAWEMALEQLEEKDTLGIEPSPQERSIYAYAGAVWMEDVQRKNPGVEETDRFKGVYRQVLELYDQALDQTARAAWSESRRLSALTHYGHFLLKFGDREQSEGRASLGVVRAEIASLLKAGARSSSVQTRWFELEGDRLEDPKLASQQYAYSVEMAPGYRACCVKLLGTVGEPERKAETIEWLKRHRVFDATRTWASKGFKSGVDTDLVRQRMASGALLLDDS